VVQQVWQTVVGLVLGGIGAVGRRLLGLVFLVGMLGLLMDVLLAVGGCFVGWCLVLGVSAVSASIAGAGLMLEAGALGGWLVRLVLEARAMAHGLRGLVLCITALGNCVVDGGMPSVFVCFVPSRSSGVRACRSGTTFIPSGCRRSSGSWTSRSRSGRSVLGAGGGILLVAAHDVADCVFYRFHLC